MYSLASLMLSGWLVLPARTKKSVSPPSWTKTGLWQGSQEAIATVRPWASLNVSSMNGLTSPPRCSFRALRSVSFVSRRGCLGAEGLAGPLSTPSDCFRPPHDPDEQRAAPGCSGRRPSSSATALVRVLVDPSLRDKSQRREPLYSTRTLSPMGNQVVDGRPDRPGPPRRRSGSSMNPLMAFGVSRRRSDEELREAVDRPERLIHRNELGPRVLPENLIHGSTVR